VHQVDRQGCHFIRHRVSLDQWLQQPAVAFAQTDIGPHGRLVSPVVPPLPCLPDRHAPCLVERHPHQQPQQVVPVGEAILAPLLAKEKTPSCRSS
jgi:hypothetical protein